MNLPLLRIHSVLLQQLTFQQYLMKPASSKPLIVWRKDIYPQVMARLTKSDGLPTPRHDAEWSAHAEGGLNAVSLVWLMIRRMMPSSQIFQLGGPFHQSIRGCLTSLKPAGNGTVQRPLASANNHECHAHGDDQQVIFKPFA